MDAFPQVLLLGNGINQAYGGSSWSELLREISTNPNLPKDLKLSLPMPLQAILATQDHVDRALKAYQNRIVGRIAGEEHAAIMRRILRMGFDDILTTNYSYELEMVTQEHCQIHEAALRRMMRHTAAITRAEAMYMHRTYNQLDWDGTSNRIWHIHGETRKPESMILGHYFYANLLQRLCAHVRDQKNRYQREREEGVPLRVDSWTDLFIMGDVYVLGFGYDVSEFDLWWLLNRKKKEVARHGQLYFISPGKPLPPGQIDEKAELLRVLGARLVDLDTPRPAPDAPEEEMSRFFRDFYDRALTYIAGQIRAARER